MTEKPRTPKAPRQPDAQEPRREADQDLPGQDLPGQDLPGQDLEDLNRTPGDGTLQGAVPAGLTVDELRKRAEESGNEPSQPGTG